MVISEGVEPSIFWMRTRRPRPLDDETNYAHFNRIATLLQTDMAWCIIAPDRGVNNMYTIRRYWRIIFPIIIAIIIWAFSSQTGDVSDASSLKFAQMFGLSNEVARTFAHIILFGAFGYSLTSFVKGLHPELFPTHNLIVYPIIITTVYGAIDEVHQITVIGRSAQVSDVLIDTLAGLCGILLYIAIFCFWRLFRLHLQAMKYSEE